MTVRKFMCSGLLLALGCGWLWSEPYSLSFDRYHSPQEINKAITTLAKRHSRVSTVHELAVSAGGHSLVLLEIGPETTENRKKNPAILVVANLQGTIPLASEGALKLIEKLLAHDEHHADVTWYILAVGNPDAATGYFESPLHEDRRNSKPHNDDMDDQVDEDGVEDLDGNGIITMMRVPDPEGEWIIIPGESRLMKKADWTKGEKGKYKLFSEGTDTDGDGALNEDGQGGVDLSINFPHLFTFFTRTGGAWAGSESEVFAILKFVFEHPEIAMAIHLGDVNFCMVPPRGGRKGTADFSQIKIPERFGKFLNMDTSKTYTMEEVMEAVKPLAPPGFEITESIVASFLGLGAVVNPLPEDMKFYREISEAYKTFLKDRKLDKKRLEPQKARDGSFELWAYYHLGIPSFALDFWTLPQIEKKGDGPQITPEKLEQMSNDDFLALGEEKIAEFLKSSGAPKNIKPKMIIEAIKNGMMDTKKMAAMMRDMPKPKSKEGADPEEEAVLAFSDKTLEGKGFVEWKSFNHPTFGPVEIGGAVPFVKTTPPARMINELLDKQIPWLFQLADRLPRIKIAKTLAESLGGGVFRISAWIENSGYLPYPIAMGERNNRIPPVVVRLSGGEVSFVEGKPRMLIKKIAGHGVHKLEWLVHQADSTRLRITVTTPNAWGDEAVIQTGGAQ